MRSRPRHERQPVAVERERERRGRRPFDRPAPDRLREIEAELAIPREDDDEPDDLKQDESNEDATQTRGLEGGNGRDRDVRQRVGVGVGRIDGGAVSLGSSWIPLAISASPSAILPLSRRQMPRL